MKVTLIRWTENPIDAIANAASNCYDTDIPTIGAAELIRFHQSKIVKHCYRSGHHSILEFADFHFHIEGISRACSHQLVRHRMASYAQRSQRYVIEDEFPFVTPPSYIVESNQGNSDPIIGYKMAMNRLQDNYMDDLKDGISAEDARYLLPNGVATVIDMKINLRSLINFMNLRLCTRAQWEIRHLANQMAKAVLKVVPELDYMLVPKCEVNDPYNFCTEAKSCGRQPLLKDVYKTGDEKIWT